MKPWKKARIACPKSPGKGREILAPGGLPRRSETKTGATRNPGVWSSRSPEPWQGLQRDRFLVHLVKIRPRCHHIRALFFRTCRRFRIVGNPFPRVPRCFTRGYILSSLPGLLRDFRLPEKCQNCRPRVKPWESGISNGRSPERRRQTVDASAPWESRVDGSFALHPPHSRGNSGRWFHRHPNPGLRPGLCLSWPFRPREFMGKGQVTSAHSYRLYHSRIARSQRSLRAETILPSSQSEKSGSQPADPQLTGPPVIASLPSWR